MHCDGFDTQFPSDIQPLLAQIDDEGNGVLEMDEITEAFTMYAKMKEASKTGSISVSSLPKEIQPSLAVSPQRLLASV